MKNISIHKDVEMKAKEIINKKEFIKQLKLILETRDKKGNINYKEIIKHFANLISHKEITDDKDSVPNTISNSVWSKAKKYTKKPAESNTVVKNKTNKTEAMELSEEVKTKR